MLLIGGTILLKICVYLTHIIVQDRRGKLIYKCCNVISRSVVTSLISLIQCNIVVITNFLFLRKLTFKVGRGCEIMDLRKILNLITRILAQTVGLQHIYREIVYL